MLVEVQVDFVQRRLWEHVHLVPYSHKALKQRTIRHVLVCNDFVRKGRCLNGLSSCVVSIYSLPRPQGNKVNVS